MMRRATWGDQLRGEMCYTVVGKSSVIPISLFMKTNKYNKIQPHRINHTKSSMDINSNIRVTHLNLATKNKRLFLCVVHMINIHWSTFGWKLRLILDHKNQSSSKKYKQHCRTETSDLLIQIQENKNDIHLTQ